MSNLRSIPNDAQFIRDNAEIDREGENPGPTKRNYATTLQLKRQAARLRKLIRAEEVRQQARCEVMLLQRKLADTLAADTTLAYI